MQTYQQRAEQCQHPLAKRLLQLMHRKQTNLSLSADVTTKAELLKLVHQIGPEICVLKTHIDIVTDFDQDLVQQLTQLAKQHDFIIFEDRKFADIGNTVTMQYEKGIYHIADWAPITNAHPLPGPGIIQGLKDAGLRRGNGLLLLAQMSAKGSLFTPEYTATAVALAHEHNDFVIGFICRQRLTDDPTLIHFIPGVQMAEGGDNRGQQYITPHQAIAELGNDVIIVGRGIYQAADPLAAAKMYREAGWQAYQEQLLES